MDSSYCKGAKRSNYVADEGEVKRSLKKNQ